MSPELIITIVIQLITIGVFIGQIQGFKTMANFRFNQLERKQDKYNNLQERLALVESKATSAHKRMDDFAGGRK